MHRFLFALPALLCATAAHAASVTAGIIAVFQTTASSTNTTASIVELNPTTANQSSSNVIAINGISGGSALRFNGPDLTTGFLSHTNDRTLLSFTGHNSTTVSGNATGQSNNAARSATAITTSDFFISDGGGLYSNNTGPAGNFATTDLRGIKSFGGTVYAGLRTTVGIPVIRVPQSQGGAPSGIPGVGSNYAINMTDFYRVQSGSNGSTYDILYILNATSATAGTVIKHSLVGNSWNFNGTRARPRSAASASPRRRTGPAPAARSTSPPATARSPTTRS